MIDLGLSIGTDMFYSQRRERPGPFLGRSSVPRCACPGGGGIRCPQFRQDQLEERPRPLDLGDGRAAECEGRIAGNDEDGLSPKLRGAAEASRRWRSRAVLPRQIGGADKEALFGAARAFALPSLSENFGNVVAEAMIRGVPVVVTERVGAAEIVKASGGGLVARSGPDDFAAALAGLLASKERLAAMGAKGAAYARDG